MVAADWISPRGRRTVLWRRLAEEPAVGQARPVITHALSVEWLIFRPRVDLRPEITTAYTLNRPTSSAGMNIRMALAGIAHW